MIHKKFENPHLKLCNKEFIRLFNFMSSHPKKSDHEDNIDNVTVNSLDKIDQTEF